MPVSVVLARVACATPDGTRLFDSLDLTFGPGRTGLVGRNGVGKTTLLNLIAGLQRPAAGSITVQGTVAMLRQVVRPQPLASVADVLAVREPLARLARLDAGAGSLADAAGADWGLPARIDSALAAVGLSPQPPDRQLHTFSGGELTRLALAGLFLARPDVILLDEPTNNLDAEGRAAVAAVLRQWRGAAIVVSHDRGLLREMDAIVELTSRGANTTGGNWDVHAARREAERAAAAQDLDSAERRVASIERSIQTAAERKDRRDQAGARKRARADMPKVLLDARKETAERSGGRGVALARRQRAEAAQGLAAARAKVDVLAPLTVRLAATRLPAGRLVLHAEGLTGGSIVHPVDLTVTGPERLAIGGRNGAGKTTLLRLLSGQAVPTGGTVRLNARWAMLDQTVSLLDPDSTVSAAFRKLNPADDENACRAALARFMFRADAALRTVGSLSGGEMLRAGLAAAIGGSTPPELLILDEPTNHLDISAIEAVEAGLRAYDGALIVVSHDDAFLDAIGVTRRLRL